MKNQILNKLRELRTSRGVKPLELANYLKIDESTYYKMENGTYDTWGEYLYPILDFYKIKPTDFFNEIEGKNFVNQSNTDFKDNAVGVLITDKVSYSDKPMVKSLLNEKDRRMELQDEKIKLLEIENQSLKLENAYLKGKREVS